MGMKGFMKKISMIGLMAFIGISTTTPVLAITPSYNVHPYSFSIEKTEACAEEGDDFTLRVSGSAVTLGTTSWTTSDDKVVQICSTESGAFGLSKGYRVKLHAQKEGTAVITAKNSKNSSTLSCKITVEKGMVDDSEVVEPENQLEAPVILSTTNSGTSKAGKISLSWTAVEGASQYQVQVSQKKDFSTTKIDKLTNKTTYTAGWNYYNNVGFGTKNPTYYYRVKAISGEGIESVWSETAVCPAS